MSDVLDIIFKLLDWKKESDILKEKYISVVNTLANEPFELPDNAPDGLYLGLKGRELSSYYKSIFLLRNESIESISPIKIEIMFDTHGEILAVKTIKNSREIKVHLRGYNNLVIDIDHLEPFKGLKDEVELIISSEYPIDNLYVSGSGKGWVTKYSGTIENRETKRSISNLKVFIAVEGPIGAGKSTLAKILQKDLGADILLEDDILEKNPFIKTKFYKHLGEKNFPTEVAFPTEVNFLLNRFDDMKKIKTFDGLVISDYFFDKNEIFADITLDKSSLKIYNNTYYILKELVPKPDFVIYMKGDVDTLYERIQERGNDYERNLTKEYLGTLCQKYDSFFEKYRGPIKIIDTAEYDINSKKVLEDVLNSIKNHFEGDIENSQGLTNVDVPLRPI